MTDDMAQGTTEGTEMAGGPQARPHVPWWKRPRVVVALAGAAAALYLLWRLGTRRIKFATDVRPDGGETWDWEFAWSIVPDMLNALSVTATVTVFGFAVAVTLGFFLALGRRSKRKFISWPFALVIEFVRSTPLLAQLFFLFFALPDLGIILSPRQTIIFGLGIHYATYCSEAYRAGINSVDKGQWEASTALNLGPATKWLRIVGPQAFTNVLPALGNFLVAGFKDAPLAAAVQVTGLLFFAQTISGRHFRPVEPFTLIGIGFLMVSLPAAWLVRRLEKRIGYERI